MASQGESLKEVRSSVEHFDPMHHTLEARNAGDSAATARASKDAQEGQPTANTALEPAGAVRAHRCRCCRRDCCSRSTARCFLF